MARLVLHIGQTKTATTSIQAFLHRNQEQLASQGLHYLFRPGQARSHRFVFHALHLETFADSPRLVRQRMELLADLGLAAPEQGPDQICDHVWQLLGTSLHSAQGSTSLLSEELLWHLGGFRRPLRLLLLQTLRRRLLELVAPDELLFVACLRHHADWAESWHNQMVKDTANQLPIYRFIRNQARAGAYLYARNLADWLAVFPEAEFKLLDFHGQLLSSDLPPGLSLLAFCGLIDSTNPQQISELKNSRRLQEAIHPFVHHWITRHQPSLQDPILYKQAVRRASRQVSRFAERRFEGQRFTILQPDLAESLCNWASADPFSELLGQPMPLQSKLPDRIGIPQPLPRRARELCAAAFNAQFIPDVSRD